MSPVRHYPLAIIVATLCYFGLGAIWFTVFRNAWLEGIGRTMEQLQMSGVSPALAYGVALLLTLALALSLVAYPSYGSANCSTRDPGRDHPVVLCRVRDFRHRVCLRRPRREDSCNHQRLLSYRNGADGCSVGRMDEEGGVGRSSRRRTARGCDWRRCTR
jgi:hypothetical protein